MKPDKANPGNFKVEKVIYTSPDGDFSIAKGIWIDDGLNHFAMRWNGDINNPKDKGYPKVFLHPMWFLLPCDIKGILSALIENSNPMIL